MSLVNVFEPSVIRGIKLRMIVEKFGKKILLLSAMSCCEPTMNQIALACSANKLIRKNPHAGKEKKKNKGIHPPLVSVSFYDAEIKKATEASKNQNWNLFDITFLNKILLLIEVDEPDFLTNEIREIKDKRNDVLHNEAFSDEAKFDGEIKLLKKLFSEALGKAENIGTKLLNTVSSQDKKDELWKALKEIQSLNQIISDEVDKLRHEKIDEILNNAEDYIQGIGQQDINAAYTKLICVNPVSFLIGKNECFRVTNFYVQPEFSLKKNETCISLDNILDQVNDKNLLIEGPSGVGKTTFTRVLMDKKESGERFQDVFIIPFECRKRNFTSVKDIISDMMPNARKKFTEDKLFQAALSFKPLFLIDGFDERNKESDKVINEILSLVNKGEARFVATTRPEGVRPFLHDLQGHKYEYFELTGIAKGNLENIVDQYYSVFSTTQHDVADQHRVKNGVLKMWGHFKDQIKAPMVLCMVIYLLVNKDKSIDQCETLTAIYKRIFECIFKKLETRLMDKDKSNFNQPRFRQDIKTFKCHLNKISLQTLKNDQISLTEDTSDLLVEDFNDAFGDEALSSVFSCKGFYTGAGSVELTSYTYPHRSFQEYLAANQISLMLESEDIEHLKDALQDNHLRNNSLIFFIAGILESENNLSKNLCEEIAAALQLNEVLTPLDNEKISAILRETMEKTPMTEAISSYLKRLYIDDAHFDLRIFNSIFKGPCPKLEMVNVFISSKSDTTEATMSLLREKDVSVELRFTSEKTPAELGIEDLLGKLLGGRCSLTVFSGRLGERGLKMLPQKLESLILRVATVDEVEGIKWLSGRNPVPHDHSQGSLELVTENHFNILSLTMLNECDVDLLPDCLPIPSSLLHIVIQNERENSMDRVIKVVRKLPSHCNEYRCNLSNKPKYRTLRLEWSSATFTDLDNLCKTIKAEGIFVSSIESDSLRLCEAEWDDLHGRVRKSTPESIDGRYSSSDIAKLPLEIDGLTLCIFGSVEIEGLQLLKERLSGGNLSNKLQPMKINSGLTLLISPICDPKLLPERFPTGDQCLHVVLSDVDGEKDFAWILDIIDILPRYQEINMIVVEITLFKIVLSFEQWEDLFSRILDNHIETFVISECEGLSQEQIIALRNYKMFDVYIDNWLPSLSSMDSRMRRLKRDKTGEICARTGLPWP